MDHRGPRKKRKAGYEGGAGKLKPPWGTILEKE